VRETLRRRAARAALVGALVAVLAASASPAQKRLDRRIPPADHKRFAEEWKTRWRNPRVLVDRDGVYVLVGGKPFAEGSTPVADLAAALVALPRKAWPYGRIVSLVRTARVESPEPLERARAVVESLGVEVIDTPVGCGCTTGG
jgi:hypothetical protein